MNGPGENQLGTRARKASLLDAKTHLSIGTWNVRTMSDTSRTTQVLREMQSYELHILGVSECRWTGFGQLTMGTEETILYSGRDDDKHMAGVALILKKGLKKALIEWQPVNERLIRARCNVMLESARNSQLRCVIDFRYSRSNRLLTSVLNS